MYAVQTPPAVRASPQESPLRRNTTPALPRLLVAVSGVVVVTGVVMALVGAVRTGVTWDEPHHLMRLRNFFDHGWYALDWSVGAGTGNAGNGPGYGENNTAVYGPVTALLLHGLAVLAGVEHWDTVASGSAAYDVRHLGVAAIGLIGTAAAAATTRILLGSWRWALLCAAALLALPMWTGHLMFNIKDVPVATGYTLITLALVSMVAPVRSRRWLRIICLAAGIVLMVGTRPGMTIAALLALAIFVTGVLAAGRFGNARSALVEAGAGLASAYGVLLLVYPNLFTHPAGLLRSAEQSRSFRGGRDAEFGYVPFHVFAQVPLLLQVCFAAGLVVSLRFVLRHWRTDTSAATRLTLVGAQVCALPLVAVIGHSDLYNGLRQLLFASPAWAVLATVGLSRLLPWAGSRGRAGIAAGLAMLALVAPTVDQLTQFPYQYSSFNVAIDATGLHVPSDYWRASVPELLPLLPTDGQIVCGPTRSGSREDETGSWTDVPDDQKHANRFSSDSSVDCRTDPLGPLAAAWSERDLPLADTLPMGDFYAVVDRDHPLPVNCARSAAVTRQRHGREITMTYVARCHLDAPALDETPVLFSQAPDEPNMAPDLWAFASQGWLKRLSWTTIDSAAAAAAVTFAPPVRCARTACTVVLGAGGPSDLTARVNGAPAVVTLLGDELSVELPRGAAPATVAFSRASGADLGLRVRSLRIVLHHPTPHNTAENN